MYIFLLAVADIMQFNGQQTQIRKKDNSGFQFTENKFLKILCGLM